MAKVWLITGASSGIGEALAAAVIERGDSIVATFRKQERAAAFTERNKGTGHGVVLDVTSEEQVRAAVRETVSIFGRIDVLVNNAGYGTIGAVEEFSMSEIRDQMETNFFGAMAVTKEVIPLMRQAGAGHILQISSSAGFRGIAGFGVYNASKFALEGFSEALALELAPFGIRVTIVEPGPFRTKFAGSSIRLAQSRLEDYEKTPVAQMYRYIQAADGRQEGDPVKGARAMVDYVHEGRSPLRLPLGKAPLQAIRAKLSQVEADLKANEDIALSVDFSEGE
jgi:NAD(P)-dependent dehydrogenase (short-subunit alcohol dehydrogenase family)